jgi:NADH-quinone oxidoreductase subunit E
MSAHELDAVATFYNLIYRRPVGRHVVLLCDSVSCWMTGADGLRMHLEQRYGVTPGTTSTDGRLTVLPIVCLGACDRAPVMMVDDDLHGEMTPDALDHALERYA